MPGCITASLRAPDNARLAGAALPVGRRSRRNDEGGTSPVSRFNQEAEEIMKQRFGKDTVIALATIENEAPMCDM